MASDQKKEIKEKDKKQGVMAKLLKWLSKGNEKAKKSGSGCFS